MFLGVGPAGRAKAVQGEITAAALRDERNRVSPILDALPIGMVLLDRDVKLLMQNRAATELARLPSGQEFLETPRWRSGVSNEEEYYRVASGAQDEGASPFEPL